ncbi:MAG: gamma-glutamyl-gamma-aminobutyrate hydrolase family protein [Dehalococcoidia bacterium]
MSRPTIAITYSEEEPVEPYVDAVEAGGGKPRIVNVATPIDIEELLPAVDGLVLTGGADIDPALYGGKPLPSVELDLCRQRDEHELPLIRAALERDLPVLGICRGMQALNVALGGSLLQHVAGHATDDDETPVFHEVFVPPGSRLTHILGVGGFMKVNSLHHQGLTLAQKAPDLLVSAFSLKDGIIEALDSPRQLHRWVVGVQWHPERRNEGAPRFEKLFIRLAAAAQEARKQA